jgi:tetratricopeptide (TPR) repeat protein
MGGFVRRGWGASSIGVIALVCSGLFGGSALASEDPVAEALKAAAADVEQGRCEQVRERLAPIGGLEHRALLLTGLCLIRAGRYPEAIASLDGARGAEDLGPAQIGDVELYRGVALYHLERYAEAAEALVAAEGLTSEPAELALYRGLLALRRGEDEQAAPDLEAAALLSPALTEPVASYYAGLAWHGAAERGKARRAFERVIAIDGEDGPWGRQARVLLGQTDPVAFFLRGSVGVEYDDNVILRGGATQFSSPDAPSSAGEKDVRGAWSFDGGAQLFQAGDLGGGLTAGYSGNAHADLDEFDAHYPRVGAYLSHRIDAETTAQLRYEFGHAWIDSDAFLRAQLAELGLSHTWEQAGTTVAAIDLVVNDLRFPTRDVVDGPGNPSDPCTDPETPCGPVGLDEGRARDRDGTGVGAALEHRYLVPIAEPLEPILEEIRLGGGYRYRYYVSQGSEWKHMSHILSAALELELPYGIGLATRASYELRDFSNPSTFPDREPVAVPTDDSLQYSLSSQDRREHEVSFTAELEKDLTSNVSLSTRWSYLDNESNRRVYDYTRHVVGGYVNVRFD